MASEAASTLEAAGAAGDQIDGVFHQSGKQKLIRGELKKNPELNSKQVFHVTAILCMHVAERSLG